MNLNAIIGARGEDLAVDWLRRNGFMIMERNWRCGRYELDIVAERWDMVHFVEVKTRKANGWSTPEDAITDHKFQSLKRAAAAYMGFRHITTEIQFDLVAIDIYDDGTTNIRYIENAMQSKW